MKNFANEKLKKCVDIAKKRGYSVWTFKSSSNTISQIFIDNNKGAIGTVQAFYSGIQFSTLHKSERGQHNNGSGFGSLIKGQQFNDPDDMDIIFSRCPYWKQNCSGITKYKSMQDYIKRNTILTYYEL